MGYMNNNDSLELYLSQIETIRLLTPEEEFDLAVRFKETGDTEAAERLVTANLRFVVKIAMEYRNYGLRLSDLIQEGNIGLMKAVRKFDPYKGYRLISYAVWWIKACIHNYIQKSWSLVKIGTTQTQRKLFNNLIKGNRRHDGEMENMAEKLNVSSRELQEMEVRMKRDVSLDAALTDDDDDFTTLDLIPSNEFDQEIKVSEEQRNSIIRDQLEKGQARLNERERFIIEHRIMTDDPMTLEEIGEVYRVSRERIRQIEGNALKKIRPFFEGMGLND